MVDSFADFGFDPFQKGSQYLSVLVGDRKIGPAMHSIRENIARTLCDREVVEEFYNKFDDKYPDANMIMQMLLLGFRVAEIPAVMHARTEGVSMHSGLKPVIYMFRMMYSIVAVWVRIKIYKVDVGAVHEDVVT